MTLCNILYRIVWRTITAEVSHQVLTHSFIFTRARETFINFKFAVSAKVPLSTVTEIVIKEVLGKKRQAIAHSSGRRDKR